MSFCIVEKFGVFIRSQSLGACWLRRSIRSRQRKKPAVDWRSWENTAAVQSSTPGGQCPGFSPHKGSYLMFLFAFSGPAWWRKQKNPPHFLTVSCRVYWVIRVLLSMILSLCWCPTVIQQVCWFRGRVPSLNAERGVCPCAGIWLRRNVFRGHWRWGWGQHQFHGWWWHNLTSEIRARPWCWRLVQLFVPQTSSLKTAVCGSCRLSGLLWVNSKDKSQS